jgi:hypothetical protein
MFTPNRDDKPEKKVHCYSCGASVEYEAYCLYCLQAKINRARQEGYDEGYAEGNDYGYDEGYEEAKWEEENKHGT